MQVKDCRKAAPKEEQVGKTCESNERLPARRAIQLGEERTSQHARKYTKGEIGDRRLGGKLVHKSSGGEGSGSMSPIGQSSCAGAKPELPVCEQGRGACLSTLDSTPLWPSYPLSIPRTSFTGPAGESIVEAGIFQGVNFQFRIDLNQRRVIF